MENTTVEQEAFDAGRRFRSASKDRALVWFDSQSNTIGYPSFGPRSCAAPDIERGVDRGRLRALNPIAGLRRVLLAIVGRTRLVLAIGTGRRSRRLR